MIVVAIIVIILIFVFSPKNKKRVFNNMNNCYSYAFNIMSKYKKKPQPGQFSNIKPINDEKKYKCEYFVKRVLSDNPNARFITVNSYKNDSKCNADETSVFLAIDDTGKTKDYHFYKKEPNEHYWSHKPGINSIRKFDSDNILITNPLTANRDYEKKDINNKHKWNYSKPCGFFCNK